MTPTTSTASRWTAPVDVMVGRVAGAGLLAWMGWIHLHLWNDGYKHLPTIGNLFLFNFIAAVILAAAVLTVPYRLLGPAAAAGAAMGVGTVSSLAISINVGLFGFKDSYNAPFAHLSIWVEAFVIVVLGAVAVRATLATWRTRGKDRP